MLFEENNKRCQDEFQKRDVWMMMMMMISFPRTGHPEMCYLSANIPLVKIFIYLKQQQHTFGTFNPLAVINNVAECP